MLEVEGWTGLRHLSSQTWRFRLFTKPDDEDEADAGPTTKPSPEHKLELLLEAAGRGCCATLIESLDHHVDMNQTNESGVTALHVAVEYGVDM